jgi:hypothetical protein
MGTMQYDSLIYLDENRTNFQNAVILKIGTMDNDQNINMKHSQL